MRKFKSTISILLAVIMLLSTLPFAVGAVDTASSGQCGKNVYWNIDNGGKLTISGDGYMWNYNSGESPFYNNASIKNIYIENGIYNVGRYMFESCNNVENVGIPRSMVSIGKNAFKNSKLSTVYYEDNEYEWENIEFGDGNVSLTNAGVCFEYSYFSSLADCKLALSKYIFNYTGKAITPAVTVKYNGKTLKLGTHYAVEYKNNVKPGIATVIIKGKAEAGYTGSKSITFKILPGKVSGLKTTVKNNSITLTWNKVVGAKGYVVYGYNPSTKAYSKISTVSSNSATLKNLKYSTKYSYAVRAYVSAGGNTLYGSYSSVVSTKTSARPAEIKLDKTSTALYIGNSTTIKATTYPSKAEVKWLTSNKSIATVTSKGTITAMKKGTATITAYFKYKDKTYKSSCKVTVKSPSVSLNASSVAVVMNKSITLKAKTIPEKLKVTWTTSNKSIATVTSSGKVTGVSKGTATITAYAKYKGKTYKSTCKVTVQSPAIVLDKSSVSIYQNKSITLKAKCRPGDVKVQWATSNKSVAKVSSSGKVTGVGKGTANITASFKYNGKVYKSVCKVTVKKIEYGTVEGCITWQYNRYVGTRGDNNATVMLIPENNNVKKFDNRSAAMLTKGTYESGIMVTKCDGYGNYSFGNKVPTGRYVYLIVSSETTDADRFENENLWEKNFNAVFGTYFSKKDLEELRLFVGYNSYTYGYIEIEKGEREVISKDFGYTYI